MQKLDGVRHIRHVLFAPAAQQGTMLEREAVTTQAMHPFPTLLYTDLTLLTAAAAPRACIHLDLTCGVRGLVA